MSTTDAKVRKVDGQPTASICWTLSFNASLVRNAIRSPLTAGNTEGSKQGCFILCQISSPK